MSKKDDILEAVKRRMREMGYHIEEPDESEGELVTRVSKDEPGERNDSAYNKPIPTLFGLPVVIVEPEPDEPPTNEVSIFFKTARFPMLDFFLVNVDGNKSGMAISEHMNATRECEIHYGIWASNKDARECYERQQDRLIEREHTMCYKGERNFG